MKKKELIVNESEIHMRLDLFLSEKLSISRSRAQNFIQRGLVKVGGVEVVKPSAKIKGKVSVFIPPPEPLELLPENIDLDIIYEDDHFAAINKRAGMVVHPSYGHKNGTMVNAALYHLKSLSSINGKIRPGIVHRLDKETSGLVLVAKNDEAHSKLSRYFKNREIVKKYLAIVRGNIYPEVGSVESSIGRDRRNRKKMAVNVAGGKHALTEYMVLEKNEKFSLVELNLKTGRTHQIRVHMAHLGNSIVGDALYGGGKLAKRQMLHSAYLEFIHPTDGSLVSLKAPIPDDFKTTLKDLGLNYSE